MKKIIQILLMAGSILFAIPIHSQERTIEEVKDVAYIFFLSDESGLSQERNGSFSRDLVQVSQIKRQDTTYLYAVNMPDSGWVIVSNEQRYTPIIGYSTNAQFDANLANQPGALRLLLEHHMNMIDSLRENPSAFYSRIPLSSYSNDWARTNRSPGPLLQRNGIENCWGHYGNNGSVTANCDKVYNKFCPDWYTPSCGHTYVGCTAVAIAQVAWYWRWPDYAMIKDNIDMAGTPYGTERKHYYDWENIPPRIYNTTAMYQVNMVAGLLRDCGYAAHMLYGTTYSQAGTVKLANALDTYNFHVNARFEYAGMDFNPILQYELQLDRPVICQAQGSGAGNIHSFVIDGYSSSLNKFHVNFGWRGRSNGWYDLGLNGYSSARTFFTEIYPDCSVREASLVGTTETVIQSGEDITLYSANSIWLRNLSVNSGGHLNVSTGEKIVLMNGFHAKNGCSVKITPNYHCSSYGYNAPVASIPSIRNEKLDNFVDNENYQATNNNYTTEQKGMQDINKSNNIEIERVYLYSISGHLIAETTQSEIDMDQLTSGVYILRMMTTDGQLLQSKFIKQ